MKEEIEVKETMWWVDRIAAMGGDPYRYTNAYHQGNITDDQLKQIMFENALMMIEDERKHAEGYYDQIDKLLTHISNWWSHLTRSSILNRNPTYRLLELIEKLLVDDDYKEKLQKKLLEQLK